ncbi:MAG: C10 family peptidase [Bacteroidales bacterium]|nr:C10 family peptidase [Candidatus Colimorpha onthohippi]
MKLFILVVLMSLSVVASALPIDSTTARCVAVNFWKHHTLHDKDTLNWMEVSGQLGVRNMYVYQSQGGFVVVAANSVSIPILGYGFDSSPDFSNIPEPFLAWLDDYAFEIDWAIQQSYEPSIETQREWKSLIEGVGVRHASKGDIPPLLRTQWGQSPYYNALCPYDYNSSQYCVTGCVATAMAQIMNYWKWPVKGTGRHSYMSEYGELYVCFDSAYYQWDLMPSEIDYYSSNAAINAVATLMYHCGVALNMSYRTSSEGGSSAYTCDAPDNMPLARDVFSMYFGYKPIKECAIRSRYNDAEWSSLMRKELESGRPIMYSGSDGTSGHAFILDGIDATGRFHINWGWRGSYDGYFSLQALNPGGGGDGANQSGNYMRSNSAIMGIQPKGVMSCNPSQLTFDNVGGSFSAVIASDIREQTPWRVTTDADWVTVTPAQGVIGKDTMEVEIFVAPQVNDTVIICDTSEAEQCDTTITIASPRSANVYISQGKINSKILVSQGECSVVDSFPMEEHFESDLACWNVIGLDDMNTDYLGVQNDVGIAFDSLHFFGFSSMNNAGSYGQYLISPRLSLPWGGVLDFRYRRLFSYTESFMVLVSKTDGQLQSFTDTLASISIGSSGWKSRRIQLPAGAQYLAFLYNSNHQRRMAIDAVSIAANPAPEPQGIATVTRKSSVRVMVHNRHIRLSDCDNKPVQLYDMQGRIHYATSHYVEGQSISIPITGVYLLRVGDDAAVKVVVFD